MKKLKLLLNKQNGSAFLLTGMALMVVVASSGFLVEEGTLLTVKSHLQQMQFFCPEPETYLSQSLL